MSSEFTSFKPRPAKADFVTNVLPEPGPPARKYALNMPGSYTPSCKYSSLNS